MSSPSHSPPRRAALARLRRDLGVIESYAALLGILIGAGIFRVTSDAYERTGPSVILGYLVLAVVVLATSVPYAVYLSTPLGREPGAEYAHVSRTFGDLRVAFLGAWLKLISFVGACAYLPLSTMRAAAVVSIASMGLLIASQAIQDAQLIARTTFVARMREHASTGLELVLGWGAIGALVYTLRRHGQARPVDR